MDKKIKVGIIYGGESFEHEVSKMTAASILKNIDRSLFDVMEIYIDKSGKFDESQLNNIDIAFLAVHGPNCEDGKLQKHLECKKIKYTGSGIYASEINMDKINMHKIFEKADLQIVKFFGFSKASGDAEIIAKTENEIGYPCFIKPNNAGSSIGISKARNIHELRQGILKAFKCDDQIIIEAAVKGSRDVEIGVLGNSKLTISGPGLVVYKEDFYTYNAKYFSESTEIIWGELNSSICRRIKKMAKTAFKATGCSGYARIDFFLSKDGKLFINEINTLPGFTATSMYPKLMENIGIKYKDLITKIINLGLE
jgi:D-alanine-D-alanine ligase